MAASDNGLIQHLQGAAELDVLAGGTLKIFGTLQVASGGTIVPNGGTAPVIGALTITNPGTPSTTIPDVGAAFSQATLNNIVASLATQINALESALAALGACT